MSIIFQLIFSEIWKEVLRPIFRFLLSGVGKDLWDTTVFAVKDVEITMPDAEGIEKFREVFRRVKETMESKGREYRTSTYNLFIELAVTYVKKKLGG